MTVKHTHTYTHTDNCKILTSNSSVFLGFKVGQEDQLGNSFFIGQEFWNGWISGWIGLVSLMRLQSKHSRDISHLKACLDWGFTRMVTPVVDSRLFIMWASSWHGSWLSPEQAIPEREADPQYSYDLLLEEHTCCILWVTQTNPHAMWEGTPWGQECQAARLTGGRLGGWLLWRSHCNRKLSVMMEISKTLCYPLCETSSLKVGVFTLTENK